MRRILIISNTQTAAPLRSALSQEGYRVAVAAGDEDSLEEALAVGSPELLVHDRGSAQAGLSQVRRLLDELQGLRDLPAIALVPRSELASLDMAAGLDDFVVLPASPEELVARVRLLLWKHSKVDSDQLIRIGGLVIDLANYSVTISGESVELTYKEFELLRYLATHRGKVFTREALLAQLWGYDYYGGTRTVDVHVRRIRAKLGGPYDALIETVRNVGYRFTDEG